MSLVITAIGVVGKSGYVRPMSPSRGQSSPERRPRRSTSRVARTPRRRKPSGDQYPNRLYEIGQLRGLTYADVAEKVRSLYANEKKLVKTHEVTIAKLATGKQKLTVEWARILAPIYEVSPSELIERPAVAGLRKIVVKGALQAGQWADNHEWPEDEQFTVMVTDDADLKQVELYGAVIRGQSMNLRYPEGSVVVLSKLSGRSLGELLENRRYHVRQTRPDGQAEETIKLLVKGEDGRYWLRPESSHPEYQEWLPLEGKPGITIELLGRVRFVVLRED